MDSASPWTIVLIDDEKDIQEVVGITLEDAGYIVHAASDGRAGLQLVREKTPEIVVTDIRMPVMDGIAVLEAVKKEMPDTEVIIITAFADMDLAIRALQLDASDFVTKPLNNEALHLALKRAIQRYVSRRQLKDYARLLEREMEDQARILHQDKMISLGRLAASVVHEINNPLSGILNYVRLMKRTLEKGRMDSDTMEKYSRYLEIVDREISRCSYITGNLLAYTRKSPPSFDTISIAELIDRCVLLCSHKLTLQKIELHTEIPSDLPGVRGDFNQLQQCVLNLMFNAIDAMPGGGRLNLTTGMDPAADMLFLDVEDTGGGIRKADLPRIFEPFYSTKQEGYGVGLGLSTVKEIMQRHGGDVRVENAAKGATRFRMTLPVNPS
ncbi:MAG: response regulator [Desulfosalsimonadaceae bacterium]